MRMTVFSGRRGSALLIVLGMLSFMIVSAVAFSMFMRQSRMPSSYLRRAASSRYLLKAALANAIARLDGQLATERQIWGTGSGASGYCEGIYDDSYPGVGPVQGGGSKNNNTGRIYDGDRWVKRVFTPFGPTTPENTVSTLTLEGLAYIPPAIINEARIYSRQTRTAMWRNLAYDAGRYAFCAIDVSDCFDINRLTAGERRFSAPNARVNLSALFPDNGASLDSILTKWESSKIPFVSVADYNIMAERSPFAPFYKYIGTSGSDIYTVSDYQSVSNALFITDTWFPPTNSTVAAANRIDLSKEDRSGQPFVGYTSRNFQSIDLDNSGQSLYKVLLRNLDVPGVACLYDYLDENRVPISLALPTVETVPMVCGLGLGFEGELAPKVETSTYKEINFERTDSNGVHKRKRTIQQCVFKGLPGCKLNISGVAAFPFKRVSGSRKGSYSVEVLAAVFFAPGDLRCRLAQNSPIRPTADDWAGNGSIRVRDGILWSKGTANLTFPDNITTTDKAVQQFVASINLSNGVDLPVYYQIHEEEIPSMTADGTTIPAMEPIDFTTTDRTKNAGASSPFMVYDKTGVVHPSWTIWYGNGYQNTLLETQADLLAREQHKVEFNDETTFRPYVAVWARVLDSTQTGKSGSAVVDLVPATVDDDETYLQGCTYDDKEIGYTCTGRGVPILDFRGDREFKYSEDASAGLAKLDGSAVNFPDWLTLYATDPRFNFAPEDWYGVAGQVGDADPQVWRTQVETVLGKNGRDPDIFMFTSDQEQLQSIGELAFLPRLQEMTGSVNPASGEFFGEARYHGDNNFGNRSVGSLGAFANGDFMWQTYTPVGHDGSSEWDPIYNLRLGGASYEIYSGSGDFRVNPFSPDERVIMAAMKDTPYDYRVACDNLEKLSLNPTAKMGPSERASWAFCKNSTVGAKLDDDELADLAMEMHAHFSDYASERHYVAPWEDAFNGLGWYCNDKTADNQLELFGVELNNPLHAVDRKFLYSFWRECFQNRQQLFLVFLRAEPLPVGGVGGESLASSQLGARGVALVWRDPQPPTRGGDRPNRSTLTTQNAFKDLYDNYGPHRTRVLFYHQFD